MVATLRVVLDQLVAPSDPVLAEASLELARTRPHTLEVVGDGPLRGELTAVAGDAAHIRFAGSVDCAGVLEALRGADLLVLPSRDEAAGLVLLEAQACGVPVVVTGGDGKAEMLQDGVTGAVLPRDPSPAELAHALPEWLPEKASERTALAARARRFVVEERSVRVGAEHLAAHYAQALA